jgi:decaprenyl-phosphate phosphoribosyltransferase
MAAEPRASEPQSEDPASLRALDTAVDSAPLPAPRSTGSLSWRLGGVILTLRPHQWVKNVFVLAPVVFAKEVFDRALLLRAGSAFAVFCMLAGAVYTMNDVADVAADRAHRLKRYRPIASGRVPLPWARVVASVTCLFSILFALRIGPGFLAAALGYFLLNVAYSLRLKHIAYLDVGCIATFFVLRVMAGGFATDIVVSRYLLACTALLALFLGFGKRRHELAVAADSARRQRAALEHYTRAGLDFAVLASAVATIGTYLAYTLTPRTRAFFHSDDLWLSTIFVALGALRFFTIVRSRTRAESPTQEMLRDGPFVAIVLGWVALVMWMVYRLRPS